VFSLLARRGRRRACLLGAGVLVALTPRAARAQAAPPGGHDEAAFDFMNLLAQHGLHDQDDERWNAYGQVTYIQSFKLPFSQTVPYNVNGSKFSLVPGFEESYTGTATLYLGLKLWKGGEVYVVPEVIAENPLSGLHGVGGAIQNFELQKTGSEMPQLYRSRTFLRQTFGLGGDSVEKSSDPMHLGQKVDSHRLVFTLGNFTITDIFDRNTINFDPRQTFLNMAFMTYSSWDFPSDARGYSWGGTAELYWDDWAVRIGRITPPQEPNQLPQDFAIWARYGDQIEIEHDHVIHGLAGAVRLLGYRNHVEAGSFADAITAFQQNPNDTAANCANANLFNYASTNAHAPDLCWVRRYNVKLGIGVNVEQHLTEDIGVFARAMYSDGRTEVDAFNPADRSLSVGVLAKGPTWRRPFDLAGAGFGISWVSQTHAQYLALGGMDGFIGDGYLTHQAPEAVAEVFYSLNLWKSLWLTADFQTLWNPGYNADRGPVYIPGARAHAEF
jgi:hypothetical protein